MPKTHRAIHVVPCELERGQHVPLGKPHVLQPAERLHGWTGWTAGERLQRTDGDGECRGRGGGLLWRLGRAGVDASTRRAGRGSARVHTLTAASGVKVVPATVFIGFGGGGSGLSAVGSFSL